MALHLLSKILIIIVALLHVLFLILEMFLWNTPLGHKLLNMDEATAKTTQVLAANQGLYNGFLSFGLMWSLFIPYGEATAAFFLICVAVAGIFGAFTGSIFILFLQTVPSLFALLSVGCTYKGVEIASNSGQQKNVPEEDVS